ncbi:hypothetical protein F2Q69_00022924 [Brassica cretica]|uniref:Uncharacterized protein n=1 Tax=Brassica cretica TaxID=69181 RepID=A0A8S9Q1E4_BRACR|nr:hypothetical protein F2Q69_00022924 [Brassica cretica]
MMLRLELIGASRANTRASVGSYLPKPLAYFVLSSELSKYQSDHGQRPISPAVDHTTIGATCWSDDTEPRALMIVCETKMLTRFSLV